MRGPQLATIIAALVLGGSRTGSIDQNAVTQSATAQSATAQSATARRLHYSLGDSEGVQHSEREWTNSKAAVFLFIANECPISNRYAPEVNRIVEYYSPRGFWFFAVHSDPDERPGAIKQHSREYGYKFPALLDPAQTLASGLEVIVTPTAVVVSPRGEILYRGRIDNRYIDFGRYRDSGIESDLRLALDAVAAGKPVANPFTKSIGCAIPPPRGESTHNHSR